MKYIILISFILIINVSYAQYKPKYTKNNFSLSLLEPGVGLEYAIAPKSILKFRMALTSITYQQLTPNTDKNPISFSFHPLISAGYRNYYNIIKSKNNGFRIDNNSANYVSLNIMYLFKSFNTPENIIPIQGGPIPSILWGIQRSFSKSLFVDANFGPGYNILDGKFMLSSELSLGIHF